MLIKEKNQKSIQRQRKKSPYSYHFHRTIITTLILSSGSKSFWMTKVIKNSLSFIWSYHLLTVSQNISAKLLKLFVSRVSLAGWPERLRNKKPEVFFPGKYQWNVCFAMEVSTSVFRVWGISLQHTWNEQKKEGGQATSLEHNSHTLSVLASSLLHLPQTYGKGSTHT